ncbi:MAG TPA: tRNA (adenosine(37)-N6)-dimethylallyltransferase MiaA [Nitrospiraceae bacterium]|nr:tRNA (adenosine(37)-N6)-dimethylallyltransferase MiaA [Nitrospiraceae bacterium]
MIRLSDQELALRPLVALVGPTAVGKSEVGMILAAALDTDLLTADSRQVYRGMDVATDKPTPDQRQAVAHRLIDLVEPDQRFNAGLYRQAAVREIERLYREHKLPLVVGGTGLYLRALIRGLCEAPQGDAAVRAELSYAARLHDKGHLHRELAKVDPASAQGLHPNDEVKIIRALEVQRLLGLPLSDVHRRHRAAGPSWSPLILGLTRDREVLYRRIEQRVERFFTGGLVEETQELLARGYGRDLSSMKGLGYRQVAGFLAGDYDYDEAVRRLKRDTRHFAKRQMTWFRREPDIHWLTVEDSEKPESVADRLVACIDTFLSQLRGKPIGREVGAGGPRRAE